MINKERLVKLLQKLVSIDSQNPPGNERKIALFVKKYLEDLGIKPRIYEFKKDRSNILAEIKSKGNTHSLLISPHLDTVPAGKSWSKEPFAGKIINNKLYGLGSTDCKCNLASSLEAIKSLVEDKAKLDYNLVFAATADEESGSDLGLIPLLNRNILKPDAALILDADDFDIVVAQKGLIHLKVKLSGKKAHGAYPWRGVNAIEIAVDIIRDLRTQKKNSAKNKYLRPPTLNVGTIRGGDKVNVVADWCEFELDFRFLPGMHAKDLLFHLKQVIRRHTRKFKIEVEGIQQPYVIKEMHPLVASLASSVRRTGGAVRIKGSEGATVITFFQEKGIPAVAFGLGSGGCAHIADEFVSVDSLYKGTLILEDFLKNYHINL